VILVIPLLVETGARGLLDRVLVVDCDETEQLARLMARDAIDATSARRILAAQASRADRLEIADDVLDNQVPLEDLEGLVLKLHRLYRALEDREDARSRPGLRLP
jgi:dephospho-CoA kinase